MEHKSGCLICGNEIVYLQSNEISKCVYCNNEFNINERCEDGHYICDKCHSSGAMDIISAYCLQTASINPVEIANIIMKHPAVKMHGPEHHFLLPAVMLSVYYRITGNTEVLPLKLEKARKRSEMIPGGFCGSHGNCGAAVGSGILMSLITEATPLSKNEWQLSNMATAKSLYSIAMHGGPRCCKRDIYLSIIETTQFVNENFKTAIPVDTVISCEFYKFNKECLFKECVFYKK
ncbi:MAG: DUF5714 domain-containing protein [Bacteroidetes bacterium]|nr:DUF5714 domain-containing protein [Bacteroidota bacterium]